MFGLRTGLVLAVGLAAGAAIFGACSGAEGAGADGGLSASQEADSGLVDSATVDTGALAEASVRDSGPELPAGWCGVPPANAIPSSPLQIGWVDKGPCEAGVCDGVESHLYEAYSPGPDPLMPRRLSGCKLVSFSPGKTATWCCPVGCFASGLLDMAPPCGVPGEVGTSVEFRCNPTSTGSFPRPEPDAGGCVLLNPADPPDSGGNAYARYCCVESTP